MIAYPRGMLFPSPRRFSWWSTLAIVGALAACGDDDAMMRTDAGSRTDAGGAMDASGAEDAGGEDAMIADDASLEDAGSADVGGEDAGGEDAGDVDAGSVDAGPVDAGPEDAGADAGTDAGPRDAGRDAPGACHDHRFGAPPVTVANVVALPSLAGGTIREGTYDLRSVETTGAIRGMARGTWVVVGGRIERIDVFTTGATLPEPNPRTESFTTAGARLDRTGTCFSDDTFMNEYDATEDRLRIRQGTVMFTYGRR